VRAARAIRLLRDVTTVLREAHVGLRDRQRSLGRLAVRIIEERADVDRPCCRLLEPQSHQAALLRM